jgi:hypothetical protein
MTSLPKNWRPCDISLGSKIAKTWNHYSTHFYTGENLYCFSVLDYHKFGQTHEDLIREDTQFIELCNGWKNDTRKTGKLPKGWESFIFRE